jgi:thioredoxin-related protein
LLPEPGPSDTRWGIDLKAAVVEARQKLEQTGKRQFIFVDFTGVTCTNCKLNEHTVFPRPEIQEAFAAYSLVQLYTDEVPEKFYTTPPSRDVREDEARANLKFQKAPVRR